MARAWTSSTFSTSTLHIRQHRRTTLVAHHADLRGRIAGRDERHDEPHVHRHLQAQEINLERSTLVEVFGRDVRDYPLDRHERLLCAGAPRAAA
jgi:hypothetical protein